jgi:reverse transcriptase-like protein
MPFSLKNARATYQRLVDKLFEKKVGRNIEIYVDDMVVKSTSYPTFLEDLRETFDTLRKANLKLNLAKCIIGVSVGKFLGFMVSNRGIDVNPEKIEAIQNMTSPKSVKDVQKLTGSLAALSRFLSKGAENIYHSSMSSRRLKSSNGRMNVSRLFRSSEASPKAASRACLP